MIEVGLSARYERLFSKELDRIAGVGTTSERGQKVLAVATSVFEVLVHELYQELDDENSMLRADLREAEIEVGALRKQLQVAESLTRTAQKRKEPKRAGVGAMLLAGLLSSVPPSVATLRAAEMQQKGAAQYAQVCDDLQDRIDKLEQGIIEIPLSPSAPTHETAAFHETMDLDAELDDAPIDLDLREGGGEGTAQAHDPEVVTDPQTIHPEGHAVRVVAGEPRIIGGSAELEGGGTLQAQGSTIKLENGDALLQEDEDPMLLEDTGDRQRDT